MMTKTQQTNGFLQALRNDDESLEIFMRKMAEFDKAFCDAIASGEDFTLRIEVNGNRNKVNHVRFYQDHIDRPKSVGKNKK